MEEPMLLRQITKALPLLALALLPHAAHAATAEATLHKIDANGVGAAVGSVTLKDTSQGLLMEPALSGLPAGPHGFHIHEKGDCGPGMQSDKAAAGVAAGGHYDPAHTGKHLGPDGAGHKGDLPVLVVDADGKATLPVLAPHLTVKAVRGRALMVHAGGDNYADEPKPLGGGGARIACGVIE
jgi:Cu-Zn family superoxide dismutase